MFRSLKIEIKMFWYIFKYYKLKSSIRLLIDYFIFKQVSYKESYLLQKFGSIAIIKEKTIKTRILDIENKFHDVSFIIVGFNDDNITKKRLLLSFYNNERNEIEVHSEEYDLVNNSYLVTKRLDVIKIPITNNLCSKEFRIGLDRKFSLFVGGFKTLENELKKDECYVAQFNMIEDYNKYSETSYLIKVKTKELHEWFCLRGMDDLLLRYDDITD